MTSSTLTGRQQQQQLLYVVLPCIVVLLAVVGVVTVIIISVLRRRLGYIDKSSEPEVVNLTSFNSAGQPPSASGLQLCASQQHQLMLVSRLTPTPLTLYSTQP